MIKKFLLIGTILIFTLSPCVLADPASTPTRSDRQHLDIQYNILTEEVEVGKEIIFEMTLENVSDEKITIHEFYMTSMEVVLHAEGEDIEEINRRKDPIILDAYESITLQGKGNISENIKWYKQEGEYYFDLCFGVDLRSFNETEYPFYDISEDKVPVKLCNMYDDPGYFEIKWMDDRDTLYFTESQGWDGHCYYAGYMYIVGIRNRSDVFINDVPPTGSKILSEEDTIIELSKEKIKDTYNLTYEYTFMEDGNFYVATLEKSLKTEIIKEPIFRLEVVPVDGQKNKYIVTNPNDDVIENFVIMNIINPEHLIDEEYFRVLDLAPNESYEIVFRAVYDRYFKIQAGYLIDGQIFAWYVDLEQPIKQDAMPRHAELEKYCFVRDYDYVLNYEDMLSQIKYPNGNVGGPTPGPIKVVDNEIIEDPYGRNNVTPMAAVSPTSEAMAISECNSIYDLFSSDRQMDIMLVCVTAVALCIAAIVIKVCADAGKKAKGSKKDD